MRHLREGWNPNRRYGKHEIDCPSVDAAPLLKVTADPSGIKSSTLDILQLVGKETDETRIVDPVVKLLPQYLGHVLPDLVFRRAPCLAVVLGR